MTAGAVRAGSRLSPVGIGLLLLCSAVWGINWPVFKIALADIPPWTFRSITVCGGGVLLLILTIAGGHSMRLPRPLWGRFAILTVSNITLWMMLSTLGVKILASAHAVLINYTMPVWAALLGVWLLGERLTPRRIAALLLGIASIGVLASDGFGRMAEAPLGAALVLAAAVCFAVGTVVAKTVDWGVPPVSLATLQVIFGGLPFLLVAAVLEWPDLKPIGAKSLIAVSYTTTIGLVFGFYAWQKAVLLLPAGVAGIGSLLIPVVGVLSSTALLGEPLTWREILALAALLLAVGLVLLLPREAERQKET